MSDEEREALANETPGELRSRYGLSDPRRELPHPELRERWNVEAESAGLASAQWWADALVVEPRCGEDIVAGAREAGLRVRV